MTDSETVTLPQPRLMNILSSKRSRESRKPATTNPSSSPESLPSRARPQPFPIESRSLTSDSVQRTSSPSLPPAPSSGSNTRNRRSLAFLARDRASNGLTISGSLNTRSDPSLHSQRSAPSLANTSTAAPNDCTAAVSPADGVFDDLFAAQRESQATITPPSLPRTLSGVDLNPAPPYQSPTSASDNSAAHPADDSKDRIPSPPPQYTPKDKASYNKMHQTSSRLLRMTDEERPYTRDFKDLFATLIVSLPLNAHRVRFLKLEQTFSSEEAINNLGSLKFSQSNRMPDPKDPSRIVTTTTTTTFSMAKEMARSVCQRFMDARLIESADGKQLLQFPLKGAVWQLTPKGMNILQGFCQRNGIISRHVLEVLDSPRNAMQLVILERDPTTDKLSQDRATIEVIFRRFTGQEGPNVKTSVSSSDSDSLSDYYNGLVGVKMAQSRKIFDKIVNNTFTGKAASDWLMDCCTTIDRRETFEIAEMFVKHGLMWAVVEDKVYMHQNPSATVFQPTKNAIYGLTERGKRICGWIPGAESVTNGETPLPQLKKNIGTIRDSTTNRLNHILQDPALRLLFREFLRNSLCEENLSFYLDVKEFTGSYHSAEKTKAFMKTDAVRETLAAAYGLYNAFLAPGSPCELNIDHSLRNSLASRMTRAVGDDESMLKSLQEVVDLFELAQNSVFKLMSSDSVPKFLRDPKYANVLREHNFDIGPPGRSYSPTHMSVPERSQSRTQR